MIQKICLQTALGRHFDFGFGIMENNIDLILAQLHMEGEELLLAGLTFVQAQQGVPRRRGQRHRRRWWSKPYLQRRPLFGQYENLMVELRGVRREGGCALGARETSPPTWKKFRSEMSKREDKVPPRYVVKKECAHSAQIRQN